MTDKVVGLRGGAVHVPGEVNDEVVAELEGLLEMAKSGEIKGVFAAVLHSDECVSGSRRGWQSYGLLGLVTKMAQDLCAELE